MPEQSTVAIISHHPQAVYFGMKSGFIPEDGSSDDEVIALSNRSAGPPEEDPEEGPVEAELPGEPTASA